MSLVITSSSQQEYDQDSQVKIGLENPSSYQNFLKSPLILDPDSEVSVVSIKCSRDEDSIFIDAKQGEGFFVYWGAEDSDNNDNTGDYPWSMDDINTPMRIELTEGKYTRRSFMNHLQATLEDVMIKAYKEISQIIVTESIDSSNVFQGFNIQFLQFGTGAALSNKATHLEFTPYITSSTYLDAYQDVKYGLDGEFTDNFVASASGTDVLITGYNSAAVGNLCDVIGKAHPLSQVKSKAVFYFNGSSATNVTDGYTLGLIRSQGNTTLVEGANDYGSPGGMGTTVEVDDDVNLPVNVGGEDEPPFFWDVAFNWVPGNDAQVIHYCSDDEGNGTMKTVKLLVPVAESKLTAKTWDRVIFEVTGEKMVIKLGESGSTTEATIVSSGSLTYGERVKPIGVTCNQLYPKIAIHNNSATKPGTAWLNTWNGHSSEGYYENNYFGLEGRDDPIPLQPPAELGTVIDAIDGSTIYASGKKLTRDSAGALVDYVYKGELASNKGIDNKYVFITSSYSDSENENLYFTTDDQQGTVTKAGRLADILGFAPLMDQTQYAGVLNSGQDVIFSSSRLPDFAPQSSMFVRLKNMAINSYNANKQSISNIIYACPKFDAQGNTGGLLFYEPAERVYVRLNNTEKIIVNSLDIDICDVNEKIVDELVGNTLVVLHFRKAK